MPLGVLLRRINVNDFDHFINRLPPFFMGRIIIDVVPVTGLKRQTDRFGIFLGLKRFRAAAGKRANGNDGDEPGDDPALHGRSPLAARASVVEELPRPP